MTEFTDKQVQWAARLVCVADGLDPDENMFPGSALPPSPQWKDPEVLKGGRRLLTDLKRQGVKATDPYSVPRQRAGHWEILHSFAPICPDAD